MLEAFAQTAQPQTMQQANPIQLFLPFVLFLGIFYFMVIRPEMRNQKKKQDTHKNMLSSLAKNDEVITTSGIHGTVMNVKDQTIILKIDDDVKIEIQKEAIASLKKKREKE